MILLFRFFLLLVLFWSTTVFAQLNAQQVKTNTHQVNTNERLVLNRYDEYVASLKKEHAKLKVLVSFRAKELLKMLEPEPPKPQAYGYQILPLVTGKVDLNPEVRKNSALYSSRYSWKRTFEMIGAEEERLKRLTESLSTLPKQNEAQKARLKNLVDEYLILASNQQIIDSHIKYNQFWQKTVLNDLARFDHFTKIYHKIFEREEIKKKINDPKFSEASRRELFTRAELLGSEIHLALEKNKRPEFLKIKKTKSSTIILVPVYTDILRDAVGIKFLSTFKNAVESMWALPHLGYFVLIQWHYIKPKNYSKGEHVDVNAHAMDLFNHVAKSRGAVLTTGAVSTYAIPGVYVALGPQAISARALAHEFGHLLGFVDSYIRGYNKLSNEDYEVLEVMPDPDDLMCSPEQGSVLPVHFKILLN